MRMKWTDIKKFYGFVRPYNFNVAVPALLNIPFLLLFLAKLYGSLLRDSRTHLYGNLGQFGPHSAFEIYYYYGYIFAGFLLFNLAIKNSKIYWPLFIWFSMELCLGVWGAGLSPLDSKTEFAHRYNYHPLLQGTPAPNFSGRNGDLFIVHNALGMRDTNNATDNVKTGGLIFVYGGSTTYDIQVSQGDTWVEKLNQNLGKSYSLFNLGVPGYSTSEHVIQTAFYSDINGIYPSCAIYYIGWNDIRNSHILDLDRGYARYSVISQTGNMATRRSMNLLTISPFIKLFLKTISYFVDTVPYPDPKLDDSEAGTKNIPLKTIFQRNVATIAAINNSRNVRTIFVGQMLNRDKLAGIERSAAGNRSSSSGWNTYMPFLRPGDTWRTQAEFNDLLNANSSKASYTYIDPDINEFDASDFVDSGHFSTSGAAKFASRISEQVRRACPASW
jgi:hypothetical protein